ncbi:carbohydrate ABC transporter permease [Streptomyces sp. NPDC004629]|uniref:carbohydrate ABC transporter permease n=1 Tax=Streptomyces sp. NPDC004629 TaxID=3364705 RepID=UPI0036C2917B
MIGTLLLPYHALLIGKYLATEAFFVFLMVQFMRNLPRELDEAARLDGCGHLRIYWSIVLPLCRPALITSAIFTFINAWNDFMGPLIYLNEPGKYTVSLGLMMFRDSDGVAADYGGMIAMSLVALLPVLLFFLAFQRYLIDGMATSHLRRRTAHRRGGLREFVADFRAALGGGWAVGVAGWVAAALAWVDVQTVRAGLPGGLLVGAVGLFALIGLAVAGLRAAALWAPGESWRTLLAGAARRTVLDPAGSFLLVGGAVLVGCCALLIAPLAVPVLGAVAAAAVAVEERYRRR